MRSFFAWSESKCWTDRIEGGLLAFFLGRREDSVSICSVA